MYVLIKIYYGGCSSTTVWCDDIVTFSLYQVADKSLAWPTSQCIFVDSENILFDASFVICINSTNIPPIMIMSMIYKT